MGNLVWLFTVLFVTVPNCIFGALLYQLAVAEIRCWACCHCFAVCVKDSVFCIALTFAGLASGICYLIMAAEETKPDWDAMLRPLLMGQLLSQATWFPIWLFLPCQVG